MHQYDRYLSNKQRDGGWRTSGLAKDAFYAMEGLYEGTLVAYEASMPHSPEFDATYQVHEAGRPLIDQDIDLDADTVEEEAHRDAQGMLPSCMMTKKDAPEEIVDAEPEEADALPVDEDGEEDEVEDSSKKQTHTTVNCCAYAWLVEMHADPRGWLRVPVLYAWSAAWPPSLSPVSHAGASLNWTRRPRTTTTTTNPNSRS